MSNIIDITVKNTKEEVLSFPLKQSIILESNFPIDVKTLQGSIALLREPREYGLLNVGDLYNFNIGYVKETFESLPIDISEETIAGVHTFKLSPKEVLKPNSTYLLYIDKNLSNMSVNVLKTLSKGPSSLSILKRDPLVPLRATLSLKVMSSPSLTTTMNIIKFQLFDGEEALRYFTINAKSKDNVIVVDGLTLLVPDTAFGLNEEFKIEVIEPSALLSESLILEIKTALSSSIKPLENIKPSSIISNEDVLDFYEKTSPSQEVVGLDFKDKTWQNSEVKIEYLDSDIFMLTLNKLSTDNLDLDNIKYREFPCFNKYDLKDLNLYNKEDVHTIEYEVIDDKNVIFTIVKP